MGWTFPWASSFGSDFNSDFNVLIQAATAQASQGPAMARAFRSLQDLKNAIHRILADIASPWRRNSTRDRLLEQPNSKNSKANSRNQ
jgi:predicted dithiol-disulfide oxidoreductase (DUF899 family)